MAKSNTIQVKMVSSADTGYFYVKNRNPKTQKNKEKPKRTTMVYHKCIVANLISLSTFPNNITMWLALAPPLLLLQGANGFKMF